MFEKKPVKKFNFGFPSSSKKSAAQEKEQESSNEQVKRKFGGDDSEDEEPETRKRVRSTVIDADDEQDFLASAGISAGKGAILNLENGIGKCTMADGLIERR